MLHKYIYSFTIEHFQWKKNVFYLLWFFVMSEQPKQKQYTYIYIYWFKVIYIALTARWSHYKKNKRKNYKTNYILDFSYVRATETKNI